MVVGHFEKESASSQNVCDLRTSLYMEEEMGTLLGSSVLLLGALPAQQKLTKKGRQKPCVSR
jgi:hypothetical protein